MTVEQFDPNAAKTSTKSSNSNESQTTTLDIPSKMIEEQSKQASTGAKVGFVSLGCPKAEGKS